MWGENASIHPSGVAFENYYFGARAVFKAYYLFPFSAELGLPAQLIPWAPSLPSPFHRQWCRRCGDHLRASLPRPQPLSLHPEALSCYFRKQQLTGEGS